MGKRIALLIGMSQYDDIEIESLQTPPHDVAAMAEILANPWRGGFDVWPPLFNPDLLEFQEKVAELFKTLGKDDLGLLFFSGHGVLDGRDLYLPTRTTKSKLYQSTSVTADYIHDLSFKSHSKHQIMIFDCCYSGSFSTVWKYRDRTSGGRVLLASSRSAQKSYQHEGRSLFTHYLVEGIVTRAAVDINGKMPVEKLHKYVKTKIKEIKPEIDMEPLIFSDGAGNEISFSTDSTELLKFIDQVKDYVRDGEISKYGQEILNQRGKKIGIIEEDIKKIIDKVLEDIRKQIRPRQNLQKNLQKYQSAYEAEIKKEFPLSDHATQELRTWGRELLFITDQEMSRIEIEVQERIITPSLEILTVSLKNETISLPNGITIEMVNIPGGTFLMGTDDKEIEQLFNKYGIDKFWREVPQHQVKIPSFFLGKYLGTQSQWQVVMGNNPSKFKEYSQNPVEQVSWYEAQAFCQRLSEMTGKKYRLPTEAELEYACRAGTQTSFYFGETLATGSGDCFYGNTKESGIKKTTLVGSFPPNRFGLYDLHGNLWEWCSDDWHDNYQEKPQELKDNGGIPWLSRNQSRRVLRGGSWVYEEWNSRSAYRVYDSPDVHYDDNGFRLALSTC